MPSGRLISLLAACAASGVLASPAQARNATAIRLTSAVPTYMQIAEIEVYERGSVNVARSGVVTASVSAYDGSVPATHRAKVNDGVRPSGYPNIWHSTGRADDWLVVTFDGRHDVTDILYYGRTDCCETRDVLRYELLDGDVVVATGILDASSGVRAAVSVPADDSRWIWSDWSDWASSCADSTVRTRTVQCMSGGAPAPESVCSGAKPPSSETGANLAGCSWSVVSTPTSSWSACSAGSRSRTVETRCERSDGAVATATDCGVPTVGPGSESESCVVPGPTPSPSPTPATSGPSAPPATGDVVVMRRPLGTRR